MKPAPGYWELVDAGEPYRVLFPLGVVLGVIGVLLWPLHVWGPLPYPREAHANLMVQGFLASFILGFLGTALPRLLETAPLRLPATLALGLTLGLAALAHLGGNPAWGHGAFLLLLTVLLGAGRRQFMRRKDLPPPSFVLVLLGILSALAGSALLLAESLSSHGLTDPLGSLGRRLLQQGFPLLPILGVGPFLLPRILGLPDTQVFPTSKVPPSGWMRRACLAGLVGLAVLASLAVEAFGYWRLGFGLRAVACLAYLGHTLPLHRSTRAGGSIDLAVRLGLVSLPLGYLSMALFPAWQITLVHTVFLSGFSLLIFGAAARVVLGHSGQSRLFRLRLRSIQAIIWIVLAALVTRLVADWMPAIRLSHYAYAAILWAAAASVWAAVFFRHLGQPDEP